MKGDVKEIHKPFDGIDKKLVIPVYQRNYDWTTKQCERLFNDIEEMVDEGRERHFFGSVVGNPEDSFTWVVIDGQQRLTTVSLLILALVHAVRDGEVEEGSEGLATRMMNNYLLLGGTEKQKFKLKPIKDDQDSYERLFGSPEFFNARSNITANYSYFRQRLRKTHLNADDLWNKGISRLQVMHLDLEPGDDPQRIFETLNSTGLALKESDKIRNLVLMDLPHEEQERVYEKYWNEMEKNVEFRTDTFVRWYLTAQTSKTPKEADVFEAFKDYSAKSTKTMPEVVKDLHMFSTFEKALTKADTGIPAVDRRLRTANMVFGDVVKPFLWLTYRDLKEGVISADDFTSLLALIETYVFRRVVVSVASNALNKIFANAYSELRKLRRGEERYSDILAYMLLSRGHSGRFPDDDEFVESFRTRDFYHMKLSYRPYVFQMLEIGHSLDVADIANYLVQGELTIEHIMPQTLSNAWREELGPDAEAIHRTWVNRIANLTITGYNSQYSNSSFKTKKEMPGGFHQSPYTINNFIKRQTTWGLEQLSERSEEMATRALEVWPMPRTDFEPVRDVLQSEPLGEDTDFTGVEVSAVEIGGAKTAVKTWTDLLIAVLRSWMETHREAVLFAAESEAMLDTHISATHIPPNAKLRQVDPALSVRVNTSTAQKVALIRRMCEAIGFDPNDITLFRKHKASAGQDSPPDPDPAEVSPYSAITALLPLVEEVEGSILDETETTELREHLIAALQPRFPAEPQAVLGGQDLKSYLSTHPVETLSAEEVLACLALMVLISRMMGGSQMHVQLLNGEVGKLLRRLDHF